MCVCARARVCEPRFYLASLSVTLLVEELIEQHIKILFSSLSVDCNAFIQHIAVILHRIFKLVNSIATDTLDEQTTIYLGFNEVLIEI